MYSRLQKILCVTLANVREPSYRSLRKAERHHELGRGELCEPVGILCNSGQNGFIIRCMVFINF